MKKPYLGTTLSLLLFTLPSYAEQPYTTINAANYQQTVSSARQTVKRLLNQLQPYRDQNTNAQMAAIIHALSNTAYGDDKTGEGDWQPTSATYQPGALHVNQNPVYRFDFLDCQTFVETAMALLYSRDLNQFEKNYLQIAYGAAGNPNGEIVRYYNRNNFVDGDLNPVNERNGFFMDATSQGGLASLSKKTTTDLMRQNWFLHQQQDLHSAIRVLSNASGPAMVQRFKTVYTNLDFPNFNHERVTISYLPKQEIALRQSDGSFLPNDKVLDKIPTPAVAEIITDSKSWDVGGVNIKDLIGSEYSVSHLGLLYRQTFQHGDVIYQKIYCEKPAPGKHVCSVTPVTCEKTQCNELMFAHATHIYPEGMYWYKNAEGLDVCTSKPSGSRIHATTCNRVTTLPLFNYLTEFQNGAYWYMNNRTILGIHIEQLSKV